MRRGVSPLRTEAGETAATAWRPGSASMRTDDRAASVAVVVFPTARGPWRTTAPNVRSDSFSCPSMIRARYPVTNLDYRNCRSATIGFASHGVWHLQIADQAVVAVPVVGVETPSSIKISIDEGATGTTQRIRAVFSAVLTVDTRNSSTMRTRIRSQRITRAPTKIAAKPRPASSWKAAMIRPR